MEAEGVDTRQIQFSASTTYLGDERNTVSCIWTQGDCVAYVAYSNLLKRTHCVDVECVARRKK